MPSVTALYAGLCALLMAALALRVTSRRQQFRIGMGDDNNAALRVAVRAHANAVEYIPIALILLLLAELNGAAASVLHAAGSLFFGGRLAHVWGFVHAGGGYSRLRVAGIASNLVVILALAALNIAYALKGA